MTPEEYVDKNLTLKERSIPHLVDSAFMRNLMNRYANQRVEEDREQREKPRYNGVLNLESRYTDYQ